MTLSNHLKLFRRGACRDSRNSRERIEDGAVEGTSEVEDDVSSSCECRRAASEVREGILRLEVEQDLHTR